MTLHPALLCKGLTGFDAIFTMENNVREFGGRLHPTHYRSNEYVRGIPVFCGGHARVHATAMIAACLGKQTPTLGFVGGAHKKRVTTLGEFRSGAVTYRDSYRERLLRIRDAKRPCTWRVAEGVPARREILFHDSNNSQDDIRFVLWESAREMWRRVALVTNHYHVERVRDMVSEMQPAAGTHVYITCVSAEETVLSLACNDARPRYWKIFDAAYAQETAHNRRKLELRGREMLRNGTYRVSGENLAAS